MEKKKTPTSEHPTHTVKKIIMAQDDSINDYRPPCPVVYFVRKDQRGKQQIYTVHCERLKVQVECYVSTAIVNLQGTWTNRTNDEV